MTSMTAAREVVARQFENVTDVDELVLRGEKRHENKCYAIAYIDLADDVVARANHLREFQERVLGEDFFQSSEQLRWNNYLYLVAGPKSIASDGYLEAKSRIEADKDYARKRVVSEGELIELLGDSKLFEAEQVAASADVVGAWAEKLKEGNLDTLLDQPSPRTTVLESIAKGAAARPAASKRAKPLNAQDVHFTESHLSKLEISRFRPVHDGRSYSFGAVTLIVGANGTGKTSLLEAIEYLYCGYNRRPAGASGMLVKGTFTHHQTGKSSTISSTSDSTRVRARCLAWYGRSERQGKAIVDAFTRYNFLDTDAAFRLSTELAPGDISKDLSRLLIGAEAATLWDYLGKVRTALEIEWKRSTEQVTREIERGGFFEREVAQLKSAPSQARSLSTTYRAALSSFGWRRLVGTTDELVASSERADLEVLAGELTSLATFPIPGIDTREKILLRIADISSTVEAQRHIENRRLELQKKITAVASQITQASKDIPNLDQWLDFCVADFPKSLSANQAARRNAEEVRKRLGAYVSVASPVVDELFSAMTLAVAEAATSGMVSAASEVITTLEMTEKDFGALEARYAQASQQLQEAALTLAALGSSARACPVCGTDHNPQDLRGKIKHITSRAISSEPLKKLQEQLQSSRGELASAKPRLAVINEIKRIAVQLQIDQFLPISEIIVRFEAAKAECANADSVLKSTQEHIGSLESRGLTESAFNTLRSVVAPLFEDVNVIEDANFVKAMRHLRSETIRDLDNQQTQLRTELANSVDAIRTSILALEESHPVLETGEARTFSFLMHMLSQSETAGDIAANISRKVRIDDNTKFADIQTSLRSVIESLDQALHAVLAESSTSNVLSEKEEELQRSVANLKGFRATNYNQRLALDVLDALHRDNSLEAATSSALDSIRLQINDVFSRIHSPSEYEYDGSGAALLRTREGHLARTLDEVSTGQRAAFALSIFLALNITAQSAPPIVLIDDPIAHIDDLNALSFMDYLRDLAVHSRRQIFFATADSRVAALFEKKFAFLGGANFQKIELSKHMA